MKRSSLAINDLLHPWKIAILKANLLRKFNEGVLIVKRVSRRAALKQVVGARPRSGHLGFPRVASYLEEV